MRAADAISEDVTEPDELLKWLQRGGLAKLEERGLDAMDVAMIREAITGFSRQVGAFGRQVGAIAVAFLTSAKCAHQLAPGDRVLLYRASESEADAYQVFTLRGEKVGEYSISELTEKLRGLLAAPELLDSVIESIESHDNGVRLRVQITPV